MKKTLYVFAFLFVLGWMPLFSIEKGPNGNYPCAFCNSKVVDSQVFYKGSEVMALVTHKPAVNGHVLIVPMRHVERFEDLAPFEILEIGETIKKVNRAVQKNCGTTGYLLVQKNGRESGQIVPHVHFHYLPVSKESSQTMLAFKYFLSPHLRAQTQEEMAPFITELEAEMLRQ